MRKGVIIDKISFNHGKLKVLDEIYAQFPSGKLSVVLGRNGSGKSTLFKIIAGLESDYIGNVHIEGLNRKEIRLGKNKEVRIGFMNQFHQTTFPYKVLDIVLTGRSAFSNFSPSKKDYEIVEETLKNFDLWELKDQSYTSLSGGERQLVLLCRVLVQKPDILLLDEPTNHLDLNYQVKVMDCIRDLANKGTMVICVMHDPNLAMMYGDSFYLMEDAKLSEITDLDTNELKQRLEQTYKLALGQLLHQGKAVFMPLINAKDD